MRLHVRGGVSGHVLGGRSVGEELMGPLGLGQRVLGGEEALGLGAVPLALRVFLEGEGDGDGPVAEVLAVHGLEGGVGCVEAGEVDEGEALRAIGLVVAHYLRRLNLFSNVFQEIFTFFQ